MVTRESGLKALHIRHHVKKGKVVPTCTFCQLPTVKNIKEPVQVKSADELLREEHEKQLKAIEEQGKRSHFHDQAWACAVAGMGMVDAALVLKQQLQLFVPMIENEFGSSWDELVRLAQLTTRRDLSAAAVKAAKSGDTRLLLKLMESGFASTMFKDTAETARDELRKLSVEALEQRLVELRRKPFSTIANSTTVEVRDATIEDKKAFDEGKTNAQTQASIPVLEATDRKDVKDPVAELLAELEGRPA